MEHNNQLFEFIVVIDFEATCDQAQNPTVTRENQEIIEFPWVVLNTSNLDIVDEGQIYCKPEWTKELTPFCTKLTGITNETIAQKGILLKDAIKKFDDYLATNIGSRSFCILTDGDWDIKTCLLREAIKKNISLSDHYYRYLNLKSIFLDAASNPTLRAKIFSETALPANTQIPSRPSLGFMLSALQLEFEGHQHSGIDDCKNIARVVQHLMKHGVSMNDYVIIPRNFNPAEETVPDFNVTKNNINDPSEMSLVPSKVIRLRGVPFRATKQDIIDFLRVNITEDRVQILKNMWNKPSGAVLVMFDSIEEAEEAMKQDKQYMGTRYIEIHYRKYEPTSEEQVIDKMEF